MLGAYIGDGPNTVSESMVSKTELSEFSFGPQRGPGRELSEFLSAYYLCAKAKSPSCFAELTEFENAVSSLFRNSTLETVFRPFPKTGGLQTGDFPIRTRPS